MRDRRKHHQPSASQNAESFKKACIFSRIKTNLGTGKKIKWRILSFYILKNMLSQVFIVIDSKVTRLSLDHGVSIFF